MLTSRKGVESIARMTLTIDPLNHKGSYSLPLLLDHLTVDQIQDVIDQLCASDVCPSTTHRVEQQ